MLRGIERGLEDVRNDREFLIDFPANAPPAHTLAIRSVLEIIIAEELFLIVYAIASNALRTAWLLLLDRRQQVVAVTAADTARPNLGFVMSGKTAILSKVIDRGLRKAVGHWVVLKRPRT